MRRAPPNPCARALCEAVALLLSKSMTCAITSQCNNKRAFSSDFTYFTLRTSHFALHPSRCILHVLHFTLHRNSSHLSSSDVSGDLVYTEQTFTHSKPLHREAFTHRSSYTQLTFTRSKLLHREAFTHSKLVHRKLLHTASFYAKKPFHTESFYTQQPFTHSKLLHTANFYAERLSQHNDRRNCSSKTRSRRQSEKRTILT